MKRIFAPWRIDYVSKGEDRSCVFCQLPPLGENPQTLILYKGQLAYVILNRFPYITGHLMIVPFRHCENPLQLSSDEWKELTFLIRPVIKIISQVYHPQGFNIGMNVGRAAGAGIHEHIHMHVLPRWNGDNNFVPVLSETRIIPEALGETYARLRPYFETLEKEET